MTRHVHIRRLAFRRIGLWLALLAAGAGPLWAQRPAARAHVRLPERLMFAEEILEEIYEQTGWRYAYATGALVRQIDAGMFGGQADAMTIASRLAQTVVVRGGVLILSDAADSGTLAQLSEALRDACPDRRRLAAYRFGTLGNPQAIARLLPALTDTDASVRHHALRSLIRLERDFRTQAPAGRESVFRLERSFPTKRFLTLMETAADRSEHEWMWSAEILGRRSEPLARKVLVAALLDEYDGVRRTAQWALDRIEAQGDRSARPDRRRRFDARPLLRAQARERDPEQRAEILQEIGRMGGGRAWAALLSLLDDPDPLLRRAALRALRRCPDPAAVPPLMHWLVAPGSDSEDRNLAGMALGLIASDAAVEALAAYVGGDADPPMSAAALALGFTQDPRGQAALIRCAARPGRGGGVLKGYAFMGLARLGTAEAVDTLLRRRSQYDNTARSIAYAAMRMAGAGSQSAVDRFVEQVRRGHVAAAHGLEMAEDPRAVDALIERLPASAKTERMRIAQSLGRIGDPKATDALIGLMNTAESANTRYQAMRALRWRWFWHRPEVRAAIAKHPEFHPLASPPPSPEEQAENTWVLRRWPSDFDDMRSAASSYEAGLVYDSSLGQVMKWGAHGSRCDSPQTSDTWLFDVGSGTWRESRPPVQPFGTCGTWGLAYDEASRAVVSVQSMGGTHGWQWNRARSLRASSPWVFHSDRERWSPMQPIESGYGPGMRGFHTLAYHRQAQAVFLYGGQGGSFNSGADGDRGWLYDTFLNEWTLLPASDPMPGKRAHHGVCYLPCLNRILVSGGSYFKADKRTWLFDLENNAWTDTNAQGGAAPGRPVVYDPVTKTALWFGTDAEQGTRIRQYDPDANAWTDLPPPNGLSPHYRSVDVAYDPRHNVFVMDGGLLSWATGHIAVRETWTYKFRNRPDVAAAGPARPDAPVVLTEPEGGVRLRWDAPQPAAAGYNVYRGRGPQLWQAVFDKANETPIQNERFEETVAEPADDLFYAITVLDDEGRESPRSTAVRARPALVHGVTVSVMKDRTVLVEWEAAQAEDVASYRVYRSVVETGSLHPARIFQSIRPLTRLSELSANTTSFTDEQPLTPAEGEFSHEVRAYVVKAVNAWGAASGPSAMALTLPSSTPAVRAREMPDGTTLVQWAPAPEKDIQGYRLYRMDEFNRSLALPLNFKPIRSTRFTDRPETPRSERRRYYVVTVNALGQEGLPSTGAYAFGRP